MSDADEVDLVSIRIDRKLDAFTLNDPECCIFRVHTQLRKVNEKAYEPKLLAICPYHHGKDELKQMEDHKLLYLQQLLQRRGENSVGRYSMAIRQLEGKARRFYVEPISLTSDEFIEMMLLDGCFIIELSRKFQMPDLIDDLCDTIFQLDWMLDALWCDVLLFENQLPLVVLTTLFEMTRALTEDGNVFSNFIIASRHLILPRRGQTRSSYESTQIFELYHSAWALGSGHQANAGEFGHQANAVEFGHLLAVAHESVTSTLRHVGISTGGNDIDMEDWKSIPSATELQAAGVEFKKLETDGFLDIEFNNGVMEIPFLKIFGATECMFRNLVAYEQYGRKRNPKYFTEYMNFMDNLINSPKDVELLRQRGIIENGLGDDEAVSTMFNKIGHNVTVTSLCYTQIFRDVNNHCRRPWNVHRANLRRNYFNSPWALISFIAAAFLLLLALTQTIFSVLSYIVSKK